MLVEFPILLTHRLYTYHAASLINNTSGFNQHICVKSLLEQSRKVGSLATNLQFEELIRNIINIIKGKSATSLNTRRPAGKYMVIDWFD